MANTLLNSLKQSANVKRTENGAISLKSTMDGIMDLFALGAAYRSRSDEDIILLFEKAWCEDPTYALKCLFYIRDCRGGQGERRFFRVVTRYMARNHTDAMRRNLQYIPLFGRWDDLYVFIGTPLEKDAFSIIKHQLALDVDCKTPSLLAKWLKSENTSSSNSRRLGTITRQYLTMTSREYRKTLSVLRERIKVLERLMSQNRWDEIEFDKLPSKAGIVYRNAFARHDLTRERYEKFAKDTTTKVNAGTLNPCDVVAKALCERWHDLESPTRLMVNKYWDNLTDYFHNAIFDGVAVVDTSGSMTWGGSGSIQPIHVAIALGMYCAEKCNPKSPWYGHYITFSRQARLVPIEGADFVDKVHRIESANLCENTNIESVFDLLLKQAIYNRIPNSEMPKNVIIISDMEFDQARGAWNRPLNDTNTLMEGIMKNWKAHGYTAPHLVFWNVNARNDNIPMRDNGNVTFISGYSATLFESLMTGKTGWDLVKEKLDSERYSVIH